MPEPLRVEFGTKTILDLRNLLERNHLNLNPGFQRKSVWTMSDRRKLIRSIIEQYPLPSIFLYRREQNQEPVYDVIDGKQRLETIFMFMKFKSFKKNGFAVKFRADGQNKDVAMSWSDTAFADLSATFLSYKIQVVEVSGELSDIVDLFVRINSTGRALTTAEKLHARYYESPFLVEAGKLAKQYSEFLVHQQIVSRTGLSRMKDVELVSELLVSLENEGPIDRKLAVDKAVGNRPVHAATLKKVCKQFKAIMNHIRLIFPSLRTTRFRNTSEFYSLFLVVAELWRLKMVLTDSGRNRRAMDMLQRFSTGADIVHENQKRLTGSGAHSPVYAEYLLSVQQSTDKLPQRRKRIEMIRSLLSGLFERKDEKRVFSREQRRILWNTEKDPKCSRCACPLDWRNFQVDHVIPHSKGGKTEMGNAALICAPCNKKKGAK